MACPWFSIGIITVVYITGWWFGTCFIFHNIWDNPSHWLIFFKIVKTTNQISLLRCTFGSVLSCWIFGILPGWSTGSKPVSRYYHGHLGSLQCSWWHLSLQNSLDVDVVGFTVSNIRFTWSISTLQYDPLLNYNATDVISVPACQQFRLHFCTDIGTYTRICT